jgi:hypothetical protein
MLIGQLRSRSYQILAGVQPLHGCFGLAKRSSADSRRNEASKHDVFVSLAVYGGRTHVEISIIED